MQIRSSHTAMIDKNIKLHEYECTKNNLCQCKCINRVLKAKYLGMDIDQNWKFYNHIENLIVKVRQSIPMLYKVRGLLNCSTKKCLYEAWILSKVRYACTIYGLTSKGLVDRLQKVLNKALKVLYNNDSQLRSSEIRKKYNLFDIKQIIKFTVIRSNYFSNKFKIDVLRAARCNNNWLQTPIWNNSYGKRTRHYVIPQMFNMLPRELRNLKTNHAVKKEVKKWIWSIP
jgi:hypothetical protein